MYVDEMGTPFIASYWREKDSEVPQYHVIFKNGNNWQTQNLAYRKTGFSLSGTGTKHIPISRPQIIAWIKGDSTQVALVFRDEERGNCVSMTINSNIRKSNKWEIMDLGTNVGSWEPSYDTGLWKEKHKLHLFLQYAQQMDGEGNADILPQVVKVMEVNF